MRYKIRKGSKIGYKKARVANTNTEVVVVLEIPDTAKTIKALYDNPYEKCRCDEAKVLRIEYLNGSTVRRSTKVVADHDGEFKYKVGKTVTSWLNPVREACAAGIHYFETKEQARAYNWR